MHVHRRNASDALGGVCSGPSAWRPASVEAPVAAVDKVADAANSAAPVRMRLRSWLRVAKVARDRCDRFWTMEKRRRECAGCRPQSARVSESYSVWRAGSLLTLGFSTALCGMVQVRRRQTSGGRVNPGYGDPDRRTSVVQLRAIALRRGQFADRYPVTPVIACKQVWRKWRARLIWTIEMQRWD